jgi:hypothetical protein
VASRIAKVFMSLAFGLFGLLVALDNLLDYDTNFAFVQHVFSMDTTFSNGRLRERAVLDPVWWHGGYALIILGEAVTGLLFLIGAARMLQALRAPAALRFGRILVDPRRHGRLRCLVRGIHAGGRRVVPDVAVAAMERPDGRLPLLHAADGRADLHRPAGAGDRLIFWGRHRVLMCAC